MGHFKKSFQFLMLAAICLGAFTKPTKRYRYDADFLDSEIQRIRSGKATETEPMWTPSNSEPVPPVKAEETVESKSESVERDEEGEESSENEDDDYYGSSEEIGITCAPDKGWHIRGQRCVPINCPGGKAERDFNTGECLYAPSSRGRYNKPFPQWNDLNHVYRSSPMSTHLVRSMILMRKG